MASNNFVQVKEATVITPSEPTPTCTLSLSTIDSQLFLRFTVEYLLVYTPSPGLDRRQFLSRMKFSLGKVLVQYYPLSGRVVQGPGRVLQVVCRAQGVAFVEAVSGFSRADFERAPRYVEEWRELLWVHMDDVLKGGPLLVVQLTWLADGAVAIGFGFNHTVCDGAGAAEFINAFADSTRGCTIRGPKPIWHRQLLDPSPGVKPKTRVQAVNSLSHPEFSRVQDHCGFMARFSSDQLVPTSIVFSRAHINHLKRQASETNKFTTFDVISAHIWRCWAGSLQLPPNQQLKLLFSVNFRNRVKPEMPTEFYGNAFVVACALTTVKNLSVKGLSFAVELIREAKQRVDNNYVKEVIQIVNGNKTSLDLVGSLILTQWSRLGFENVDFGLGKPAHIGPICGDKYCMLLPVQNQRDAVRVMVAVPTTSVDLYQYLLTKPFS